MTKNPVSRPGKYAAYQRFLDSIPARSMDKRPKYLHGIGVFRGLRGDVAWIKIKLPHGGIYKGKSYKPNQALEIKVGNLDSFTWEELLNVHMDYQRKADHGQPLEALVTPLFSDYADQWLDANKHTLNGYSIAKGIVENHLKPFFGHKTLKIITTSDIDRWQSKKLDTLINADDDDDGVKYTSATVKRQKNVLSSILSQAIKDGHVEANPCANSNSLKIPETSPRYLTGEELVIFLVKAEEEAEWLPDCVLWAVHSGMRRGEILNLLWRNIIEANEKVVIKFSSGKTHKIRTITCSKTMKEIIRRQKTRKKADSDAVFPISLTTLKRKWDKARKEAGISDVTIQDMRNTSATYAAASGVDLKTLASRLGHSDLKMLERHYAGLVGSNAEEAANKLEKVLGKVMRNAKQKSSKS